MQASVCTVKFTRESGCPGYHVFTLLQTSSIKHSWSCSFYAWAEICQSKLYAAFAAQCVILSSAILYSTGYGITINVVYHLTWFLKAVAQRAILFFSWRVYSNSGLYKHVCSWNICFQKALLSICQCWVHMLFKYCYSLASKHSSWRLHVPLVFLKLCFKIT